MDDSNDVAGEAQIPIPSKKLSSSIDDTLRQLEEIFDAPWTEKCTCGSDPEGHCDFCSAYEKARKKARVVLERFGKECR